MIISPLYTIFGNRFSLIILICLPLTGCLINRNDSVKIAKEINDKTTLLNREMSHFVIETIDTRRFMVEAGLLASHQGTTAKIRQYGELMVRDQSLMIKQIRTIAASRRITLPDTLSLEKVKYLESLKEKQGLDFDKKFIKKFATDHRHDLKTFEKATTFEDRYVRIFARRNLPIIQLHLGEIQRIKEENTPDSHENILVVSN